MWSDESFKLDNEVSSEGVKRASTLFIADSGSTRHAVIPSMYGTTNYCLIPDHTMSTTSCDDLKVQGIGDLAVGFRSDSEQKPGATMTQIIPLKDALYIPGLTGNLLSLPAMAARDFEFHGKEQHITFCGVWLRLTVVDYLYSFYGFPITK